MIGQLRGTILDKQPPHLLLDVAGVGYEISAPMSTFYQLPDVGADITLFTHLVVREDAQLLYGFYQQHERRLFRSLIKVNGVGPKLALTILSGIEPDDFVACITNQDVARLTCIPGIGKKTAERLLIETRDALAKWQGSDHQQTDIPTGAQQSVNDAVSALTALGYKAQDAKRIINKIHDPQLSSEQLIRQALKHMAEGVA